MKLQSFNFIYLFLPFSIIFYYIFPKPLKPAALLAISALFAYACDPRLAAMTFAMVACDYILQFTVRFTRNPGVRYAVLTAVCIKNLACAVYSMTGRTGRFLPVPFFVLTAAITSADALADVMRGISAPEKNPCDFLLCHVFYGKYFLGPLALSEDFMPKIKNLVPSFGAVGAGILRFLTGMAKLVFLAEGAHGIFLESIAGFPKNRSVLGIVTAALSLLFYYTLTFAAYSDISKGIAGVYSLSLPTNSYFPLGSTSFLEFLEKTHLSLFSLVDKYLPLRPVGNAPVSVAGIVILPFLQIIYFGMRPEVFLWAVLCALIILLSGRIRIVRTSGPPAVFLKRAAVFFALINVFAAAAGGTALGGAENVLGLYGLFGVPFYNESSLYILKKSFGLIAVLIFFSSKYSAEPDRQLKKGLPVLYEVLRSVWGIAMLWLVTLTLV